MEQALTCPDCGPSWRLLKVEGDSGAFLRCSNVRCSHRQPIPLDQRMREAGVPSLLDWRPA